MAPDSSAPLLAPRRQAIVSPRSFDWRDAGIGAAAGMGLTMLAVGAALLLTGDWTRTRSRR